MSDALLIGEIVRLQAALRFYANELNWIGALNSAERDRGKRARAALRASVIEPSATREPPR